MKTRIAAAVAALVLGAAPLAATAQTWGGRYTGYAVPTEVETTGSIVRGYGYGPVYAAPSCPQSSAAEGNANQQHFPVKQYGQTSGGYRC